MAKVTKQSKSALSKEEILNIYIKESQLQGEPKSILILCQWLSIEEKEFYEHFSSIPHLKQEIWTSWFHSTVKIIQNDDAYSTYTIREKLLAFYYTWFENLLNQRSYVLLRQNTSKESLFKINELKHIKTDFQKFIDDLILQGKDTEEIAERPFSNQYSKPFWLQFVFLLNFWCNDSSQKFEKTDAAIEKSVNFSMDLLARGAVDSFIDLTKFLFQNRSK